MAAHKASLLALLPLAAAVASSAWHGRGATDGQRGRADVRSGSCPDGYLCCPRKHSDPRDRSYVCVNEEGLDLLHRDIGTTPMEIIGQGFPDRHGFQWMTQSEPDACDGNSLRFDHISTTDPPYFEFHEVADVSSPNEELLVDTKQLEEAAGNLFRSAKGLEVSEKSLDVQWQSFSQLFKDALRQREQAIAKHGQDQEQKTQELVGHMATYMHSKGEPLAKEQEHQEQEHQEQEHHRDDAAPTGEGGCPSGMVGGQVRPYECCLKVEDPDASTFGAPVCVDSATILYVDPAKVECELFFLPGEPYYHALWESASTYDVECTSQSPRYSRVIVPYLDEWGSGVSAFYEEQTADQKAANDAQVLRSLHPPTNHANMSRGRPPPVEAVMCASVIGKRVVSVADLHGDFVSMLRLLQGLGLVSRRVTEDPETWQSMWAGGTAIFIQMGDILDRGSEGQRMWKFLWALQDEPSANVVLLLGNHEAWYFDQPHWVSNRDGPTEEDMCSYTTDLAYCLKHKGKRVNTCVDPADPPDENKSATECISRAWSLGGFMGRQLLARLEKGQMKMAHAEARTLFVHAGVTRGALELLDKPDRECIAEMNQRAFDAISHGFGPDDFVIAALQSVEGREGMSRDGPTWTRRFGNDYYGGLRRGVCEEVKEVVERLGVDRMVKGHDPQDGWAKSYCDSRLLLTDTRMSEGYTGGRATSEYRLMALEMSTEGTDIRFVYPMRKEGQQCEALSGVVVAELQNAPQNGQVDEARPLDSEKNDYSDEFAARVRRLLRDRARLRGRA